LAGFLAAFAGSVLAGAQRREQATLRLRGAHRGHLRRMLAIRSALLAGAGSLVGTAGGFVSALIVLGPGALGEARAGTLVTSAILSVVLGVLTTAAALYVPGRRSLRNEIAHERGELAPTTVPAWRRRRLDLVLLAAAVVGEVLVLNSGAFSAPAGSVYQGQGVSLPSRLLTAPILAWIAGVLVAVRVMQMLMTRLPLPAPPRFGPLVRGTLARSVRRRSWALAGAIICVGLVTGFGTALATFTATYDAAKAADSRYLLGADIRVTPSILSRSPHPPSFAHNLVVPGIAAATPAVFSVENAVLTGPFNEDRQNLAAVDPAGYLRVSAPSDRFFVNTTARAAMRALRNDPRGLLVDDHTATSLQLNVGDRAQVLLARGTHAQHRLTMHVVGLFHRLPGFPEGATLLTDLRTYEASTGQARADIFLARSAVPGTDGLSRAVAALRAGPGRTDRLNIQTTHTALGKDQSSLTALNVRGLVNLDGTFTLLMAAASVSIFVFGLVLERRREYVTLRAQGAAQWQVRALVVGETGVVGISGLLAGVLVGLGMGALLVRVLRPLFVLPPAVLVPLGRLSLLIGLALVATLVSALVASVVLRRLRATELLRET
ncbi:MAG: ABC transporter permease, partial [Actinomycetota bacterium]|nr:ABC transporter permease [Actinomycetota bacterium]